MGHPAGVAENCLLGHIHLRRAMRWVVVWKQRRSTEGGLNFSQGRPLPLSLSPVILSLSLHICLYGDSPSKTHNNSLSMSSSLFTSYIIYESTQASKTKYPSLDGFNHRNRVSRFSMLGSPRSGASQFSSWWGLSLAHRWLSPCYILIWGKETDKRALWCLCL